MRKSVESYLWICIAPAIFVAISSLSAFAQGASAPDRMEWWRDARFGMFIHWGPVSLKGTEIGWSRGGERRGTGGTGEIPVEVYDNLYKEFNPTEFDAREWVNIAKQAGMKYLVFTTRHHDGFSMFDTAYSDYKITNSPFKRDIVAELAAACHEAGLRFVYVGNVPGHAGENTVCPNCKRLLVRRTGAAVEDIALRGTFCGMCGENVNVRTKSK